MQNSHPFHIDKTLASCNIVINSLKRLCTGIDLIVQLIFIALYSYSIYTNLDNVILLSINSVLLGISVCYLIIHIILTANKKAKKIKSAIRKTVKYVKMSLRLLTIGLATYELLGASYTDIKLIATLFATVGFLIQCIFEVLKYLTERYINVIIEGVKMDVDEFMSSPLIVGTTKLVDAVKNPQSVLLETLNKPFSKHQPKIERPEPTKLQSKISDKAQELNQKKQTINEQKQEQIRQQKIQRAQTAFTQLKTNVKNSLIDKFFTNDNDNANDDID